LNDVLYYATSDEPQLFSDTYARLLYIADKHTLPTYLLRELHAVRLINTERIDEHYTPAQSLTSQQLASWTHTVALLISHLSNLPITEQLLQHTQSAYQALPPAPPSALVSAEHLAQDPAQHLVHLRINVRAIHRVERTRNGSIVSAVDATSDTGEPLRIAFYKPWTECTSQLWKGATLHCTNLRRAASKLHPELPLYITTPTSLVVLEPDYLVDVTDIAECFHDLQPRTADADSEAGFNPMLYLLRKFFRAEAKESLVFGSIVNSCFDALIADGNADFELSFAEALLHKLTALLPLLAEHEHVIDNLKSRAEPQFYVMQAALEKLGVIRRASAPAQAGAPERHNPEMMFTHNPDVEPSAEPSFLSPEMGLQGRLDLMIEYTDDKRRKSVVELKSSKPPEASSRLAWSNNAAQVACYNLLLDATFGNHGEQRSGDSMILYSRDPQVPLRNIPNDHRSKQHVIRLRNELIVLEHELCERRYSSLKRINTSDIGVLPSFMTSECETFEAAYRTASATERRYFHAFISFVARENWSARLGVGLGLTAKQGFSALWRQSLAEKEATFSVLSNLRLNKQYSDFERMHLYLERTEHTPIMANFRVGDVVILLQHQPAESSSRALDTQHKSLRSADAFVRAIVLKGTLRTLADTHVVITLRNKRASTNFDDQHLWYLEQDFFGTEFTEQYRSLFDFLRASSEKRDLLLGIRAPLFDDTLEHLLAVIRREPMFADLTDEQHIRLAEAMSARDYYILQGPPGTGKTSRMIRSMAQFLHEHTEEHIILLAFTNRAVDELCDALKRAALPFVRLGSKDATAHKESVLIEQLQGRSPAECFTFLKHSRIIVSTISSLLKTQELLAMKDTSGKSISTAIIDEASQVVEPQIVGLMARFKRTILVGDEKQLPAVVVQPERGLKVTAEDLNALGIQDLRVSLFERLLTRCQQQAWSRAFGIISFQGRMHEQVQEFSNERFYAGKLKTLHNWQRTTTPVEALHCLNGLVVPALRVVFIATAPENRSKVHTQESRLVAHIVHALCHSAHTQGELFSDEAIGVITPFRAQIAAIVHELSSLFPRESKQRSLLQHINIDTVERYQGSERDVIIISLAVSHSSQIQALQSLSPDGLVDRKLNVALTRARKRLIVLGCTAALESPDASNEHWKAFLHFVRERGGFVSAEQFSV
jgi:DNA replication ATP-dependent helicase Dna2